MISFQTVKFWASIFAPFLIVRAASYIASARVQGKTSRLPIRPVPADVRNAINLLFIAAALAVFYTVPYFSPENIFSLTSSRLQTPTDVLFNRLSALRPGNTLTETDALLRSRLASTDGRCLYLTYGPSTTAHCPFCSSDRPMTFFYYAAPSILFLHVCNLFILGAATSGSLSGREGNRWRPTVALAGGILAVAELYIFQAHDWKANVRALRPQELDNFYWKMRIYRGLLIAALDAAAAGLLWVSSTNRFLATPKSTAEQLESLSRVIENTRAKLGAVGIVRNVTARDEQLRRKGEAYWRREGEVMGEVMDEREVVESLRNALESGRVNVLLVEEEARKYAEGIMDQGSLSSS